jgi:hypothetical protein
MVTECEMISGSKLCPNFIYVLLIICGAHVNILDIVKVKTLVLIKIMVIYGSLPIMLTIYVNC